MIDLEQMVIFHRELRNDTGWTTVKNHRREMYMCFVQHKMTNTVHQNGDKPARWKTSPLFLTQAWNKHLVSHKNDELAHDPQ